MTRQRLKDLATLARRKGRRQHGEFLVEGVRSVEAAVTARAPLVEVLVADGLDDPRAARLAARADVPVWTVAAHDLERVGDARSSQGVIAVARSVVSDQAPESGPALVLDGVQDPGNVGALIRTAAWFGVRAVVADEATADPESPKAVRASMGGLWDVEVARVPALAPVLAALAAGGAVVWGAAMGGTSLRDWAPSRRDALVLGSEAHGLSSKTTAWIREHGGGTVHVPGPGHATGVESLNVAVAGGIVLSRWLG